MPLYNSCRDRHCPTCQTLRKQRWLEKRRAEVLPVPYFHVVFTLPQALDYLARYTHRVAISDHRPSGFQKVRAYGWLAPRNKQTVLGAIRQALGAQPPPPPPEDETAPERILRLTGIDVTCCPVCGKGHLVCVRHAG